MHVAKSISYTLPSSFIVSGLLDTEQPLGGGLLSRDCACSVVSGKSCERGCERWDSLNADKVDCTDLKQV